MPTATAIEVFDRDSEQFSLRTEAAPVPDRAMPCAASLNSLSRAPAMVRDDLILDELKILNTASVRSTKRIRELKFVGYLSWIESRLSEMVVKGESLRLDILREVKVDIDEVFSRYLDELRSFIGAARNLRSKVVIETPG